MNRGRDSDEESSQALSIYVPKVADIPDLVNMIADFCDDAALSKLSRVINIFYNYYSDKQRCPQDDYRGEQGPVH